jgi:pyruvate,orthophosphate dikinase
VSKPPSETLAGATFAASPSDPCLPLGCLPLPSLPFLRDDPFATIDQTGVGQLIKMAVEKGNQTRPGIKLGICGEHGGDPESVKFCHRAGLTYVSCSPYRVPVARLAAAQAALEEEAAQAAKKAKKK